MFRIPLSYNPIDHEKLGEVLRDYGDRNHQEMIVDFERMLCQTTGAKYAVALNSGTAAIHLALKALGVGAGDTVIASTFTYVATINPILYQQAVPFLVDSEPDTWNMDPVLLRQGIESLHAKGVHPKAIILVHTYGMPASLREVMAVADDYGIPVIEDAAEALGTRYHQQHVGNSGRIGILSFNNNKLLTTYGGGAIMTGNAQYHEQVLYWATQARNPVPWYEHADVGFNYRMSPLNAAAGLSQLGSLDQKIRARKQVFESYRTAFRDIPGYAMPIEPPDVSFNYWFSTLVIDDALAPRGMDRSSLVTRLQKHGMETRPFWNPMHRQPVFQGGVAALNGIADSLYARGVCLPSGAAAADNLAEILEVVFQKDG